MAFVGGFFGKIVASIFVAAYFLLGFGPDKWAEFMIEGFPVWMSWFTPDMARAAFFLLGGLTTVVIFVRPFSFGKWFERDHLELYELAYLSVGKRPKRGKEMPDDVLHRHRLLKDAINEGKLAARNLNADGKPNVMSQIHIDEFTKFATDNNHKDFIRFAERWSKRG